MSPALAAVKREWFGSALQARVRYVPLVATVPLLIALVCYQASYRITAIVVTHMVAALGWLWTFQPRHEPDAPYVDSSIHTYTTLSCHEIIILIIDNEV